MSLGVFVVKKEAGAVVGVVAMDKGECGEQEISVSSQIVNGLVAASFKVLVVDFIEEVVAPFGELRESIVVCAFHGGEPILDLGLELAFHVRDLLDDRDFTEVTVNGRASEGVDNVDFHGAIAEEAFEMLGFFGPCACFEAVVELSSENLVMVFVDWDRSIDESRCLGNVKDLEFVVEQRAIGIGVGHSRIAREASGVGCCSDVDFVHGGEAETKVVDGCFGR